MATTLALFGQNVDAPFSKADAVTQFQVSEEKLVEYLRRYFAKTATPVGFALYQPGEQVKLLKPSELSHFVGGKKDKIARMGADNKQQQAVMNKIIDAFELVKCDVDPTKPPVFEEKKQTCINLFGGWLHPLNVGAPTPAEMKLIKPQLDHIRNIWAGKKEEMYQLLIRWFARIAQLSKNQIGLYLKGPEGIGKSIIFDLMREHVFGMNACLSTDKPSIITGAFNAQLMGRAMLVLEEMPTATDGQYRELTNSLKIICTGQTLETTKKFQETMTVRNTISVAVLSNRNALALQAGDRRWAELDLDDSKKGDMKYFSSLALNELSDAQKSAWGLAMWKYLRSVDLKGHADKLAPMTEAKATHTMPPAALFIKQTILEEDQKNPKNLRMIEKQKYSVFYDKFKAWWPTVYAKSIVPCAKVFSIQLKMIKCIENKQARWGGNPVATIHPCSREKLIEEFEANKWIDREIDNIPDLPEQKNAPAPAAVAPQQTARPITAPAVRPAAPRIVAKPQARRQGHDYLADLYG